MGNLNYLKIWHDNSGQGDDASWFLKYLIVHDLQTRERFYFLCQDWLAVEKSDGKIERKLFVACEAQKTKLKHLMQTQAKNYMMDHHLWLSIFFKPIHSSFSRLDRVTCCFLFHYISMLLNIVYYGDKSNTEGDILVNFGLVSVTTKQVNSPYCMQIECWPISKSLWTNT